MGQKNGVGSMGQNFGVSGWVHKILKWVAWVEILAWVAWVHKIGVGSNFGRGK